MKERNVTGFLPVTAEEMKDLGWDAPDFVYVSGDAYVDHPSFGPAIISRVLEDAGFRVAMLPQPDFRSAEDFRRFGRPRLGFLVTGGNIDSMVAHYTVSGKKRNYDYYSPGGRTGLRPDRAVIVYCNRIREVYGDIPILIGGLEASLRRFAHYDYWENKVRRGILLDSRADILMYGMGEKTVVRLASLLDRGVPVRKIRDVRGTVYLADADDPLFFEATGGWTFEEVSNDKAKYASAFAVQYREQDHVRGKAVTERYGNRLLVQNPPMEPLEREELDRVYALPYQRTWHPIYDKDGGVPGISEVKFSVTHNRGCFGACNFCALAFHQGRSVRSRSIASCVEEAKKLTALPDFKGYIHDVGGPTANFRYPSCDRQKEHGVCSDRKCLAPKPCPNLKVDHREYVELLKAIEAVPGVKKVFIRSGIRFDYLICDKDETFFRKLVRDHVSGQLKVAPEHCSDEVLRRMGKPSVDVYRRFTERYFDLSHRCGKDQYLVPYLMSSHPGSTLRDAVELAVYLKNNHCTPEQVQDFYPTPGTISTCEFYTGIDPLTGKPVFVETDPHEKKLQRALLQWYKHENAPLIREALIRCGREDLIGSAPGCLVPAESRTRGETSPVGAKKVGTEKKTEKHAARTSLPAEKSGTAGQDKPFRHQTASGNVRPGTARGTGSRKNKPRGNGGGKK